MLFGLKAAVLAIVVEAVIRIGRKVLRNGLMYAIAAASFIAIFVFDVPFAAIIIGAALIGLVGDRFRPDLFEVIRFKEAKGAGAVAAYATDAADLSHTRPNAARTLRTLGVWLALWFVPVIALHIALGADSVYVEQAWFFSKAAVLALGGAYAVLAYIAQEAVAIYGWLEPGEMLTGLGMAETTPGPLIQVVQFVGYIGAYREPGSFHPVTAGVLASVLTTWVTFVPCFLWIFVGAPFVERIRGIRSLTAALSTITAAVVGVVLNLAAWFAVHTLFGEGEVIEAAGARLSIPVMSTISWPAVVIVAVSGVLIFRFHWGVLRVILVAVAISILWGVLGWAR